MSASHFSNDFNIDGGGGGDVVFSKGPNEAGEPLAGADEGSEKEDGELERLEKDGSEEFRKEGTDGFGDDFGAI